MQIERLFEIVYILLEKGTVTAQELSDKLNVSKRTILRDIETLTLAKVPVCTTQGKGGGISLLNGYVLDKAVLSDEEKEQSRFAVGDSQKPSCGRRLGPKFMGFGADKGGATD